MTCTSETIRIFVPRLPVPRPIRFGFDRWREWFHAFNFWSCLERVDSKISRRGSPPRLQGPCKVRARIFWYRHPGQQPRCERWSQGILDALERSGVATNVVEFNMDWVPCDIDKIGTEIEIQPLEDQ